MNINFNLSDQAKKWLINDLNRHFVDSEFKPDYEQCLEQLEQFNTWVSQHEFGSELAGILTGIHNCQQRHLLTFLMPKSFYCSITSEPDIEFVKKLIQMYYDSVVHYMKCL